MARSRRVAMANLFHSFFTSLSLLLLLIFISSSVPHSLASSKKPPSATRKGDIPFIKCQVCEKTAHQIIRQVKKKVAEISPKKVSELQIIEISENICNLKKEEGDWLLQIDIVENGDKLELVEQGVEGQCNSECKTIERACQEIMSYLDTDVAEYVYSTRPSTDQLANFLCEDLSKACNVKPPPLPVDRISGESFVPKSSKEAEMEKLLRSMEGMPGAPGMKMYSREDLMSGNFGADDEDDEDNDDDNFFEKLGTILNEKDSPKQQDYVQKIMQGYTETVMTTIKGHINEVSNRLNWWRGKTNAPSPAALHKTVMTAIKGHINEVSNRLKNWWRGKTNAPSPAALHKTDL